MRKNITFKNKKIGEVISYLEIGQYRKKDLYQAKKDFVDFLIKEISSVSNDCAGFQTKKRLKDSITGGIFDFQKSKDAKENYYNRFPVKDILLSIKNSLCRAYSALPSNKPVKIFLFPTLQSFVKNKMSDSSGYTPNGESIYVYLSVNPVNRKQMINAVKKTLTHEYNHAVRFQYFPNSSSMTLLETLIFEGLAENFTTEIADKNLSPWASSLTDQAAAEIFKKIKSILSSTNRKAYYSVFFENKKFPLWAGYAIGYRLVKKFRKINRDVKWLKIIQMSYTEIFERTEW
ncbi:MAG: hypothetical protein COV47_00090 [Candidatus Diapherotrites archaeon CG11_big_fil_rev_8_21_14_0_20_37_9]|nr:MAG: hypothetical protein COV47_00090 [Candidatus Diapherotrites archaeon CG11_big_fil_rev_8_21_14_0_20_37_9]